MNPMILSQMFEDYVKEAKQIQQEDERFLVGMEIEWIYNQKDEILDLVNKYKLDYFVGSVHHIRGIPIDYNTQMYQQVQDLCGGLEELFCEYFDAQYEMLQCLQPIVVGHFDLIRIFRPDAPLTETIWKKIDRNIDFIFSYGGIVELNSRAWKKSNYHII